MNQEEVYVRLTRLFSKYFDFKQFEGFINHLRGSRLEFNFYYANIVQKNNEIQLETSFLSKRTISDFTLSKNGIITGIMPISKISYVQSELLDNSNKMILNIYSDKGGLVYSTFTKAETGHLLEYSNVIINHLNQ